MTTSAETAGCVRIVRGSPSPDELAALLTVLTTLSMHSMPDVTCPEGQERANSHRSWKTHHSPGSWRRGAVSRFHRSSII
ncbi:acyl-CoA carboxylase subunit epsilon [Streptomyces sp. NPDC058954]|uniref:acyl-CoA carboxylase subunit epsilon n=1 Tax=Streptomyces sp. NPDC058954 TaxID=3346677 RepID=UPI0036920215